MLRFNYLTVVTLYGLCAAANSAEPLPSQLLWGDTHLHTALSGDAVSGGVKLPPETAYRFAQLPDRARLNFCGQCKEHSGQRTTDHRRLDDELAESARRVRKFKSKQGIELNLEVWS